MKRLMKTDRPSRMVKKEQKGWHSTGTVEKSNEGSRIYRIRVVQIAMDLCNKSVCLPIFSAERPDSDC